MKTRTENSRLQEVSPPRQPESKSKSWAYIAFKKLLEFAVVILCGGGVLVYVLSSWFQPSADLFVLLTDSLPTPVNHGLNQILVIRNDGRKLAVNTVVTIQWPRTVQPIDYKIKASSKVLEETREDTFLRFKLEKLPPMDYVTIVMAVTGGHQIKPTDVRIVHDDGVVNTEAIEFSEPCKWRSER